MQVEVDNIKLYGSRVLLEPYGDPFEYEVESIVPSKPTNIGDVESLDNVQESEVETIKRTVLSDIQLGRVVAIGDDKMIPFNVGDIVYYNIKTATLFEPMRTQGIRLINYFNVLGCSLTNL